MTIIYAEIYVPGSLFVFIFFLGSFPWQMAKRAMLSVQICAAWQLKYPFVRSFVLQINPRWTAPPHHRTPPCPPPRPRVTSSREGPSVAARAIPALQELAEQQHLEVEEEQEPVILHSVSFVLCFIFLLAKCPLSF